MKRFFGLASAVVLALALTSAAVAQVKVPELKLSTALAPVFPLGKAGERWAQLINDGVAGAFEIRQYPGATLAGRDPGREFVALRAGAADLAVGSAFSWSTQMPWQWRRRTPARSQSSRSQSMPPAFPWIRRRAVRS